MKFKEEYKSICLFPEVSDKIISNLEALGLKVDITPNKDPKYPKESYDCILANETGYRGGVYGQSGAGILVRVYGNYPSISFIEIQNPQDKRGNGFGGKMMDAVMSAIPKDYKISVHHDFSAGFWPHMKTKYKDYQWDASLLNDDEYKTVIQLSKEDELDDGDRVAKFYRKRYHIDEDYKYIYDSIYVYVVNTHDGGGWQQELPLKNNSISETIREYRKGLGWGYRVEYIGPAKKHLNTNINNIKSDNNIEYISIFDDLDENLIDSQFELGKAGYILPDGNYSYVDGYHGEDEDTENRDSGLPEFSNTHAEDDTCIRIYKEPNEIQYQRIESIIDTYLDMEGYCKIEVWEDPGTPLFYGIYSLYDNACDDKSFKEQVGNWTGYKLVQIIKNYFKRRLVNEELYLSNNPMSGPMFINTDGKFIRCPGDTHLSITGQLKDETKQYKDINELCTDKKWIRINDGSIVYTEVYVNIPDIKPSEKQFESILKYLDFVSQRRDYVSVDIMGTDEFKIYNFAEYSSDEIVEKIRDYFSMGKLKEDLSQQQKEFFKDSKIRDKDGNLLVCYHGTNNPGFKEFNHEGDNSQFGNYKFAGHNVNFFATNRQVAKGYTDIGVDTGDNIYACYLNIVNPYIVNNERVEDAQNWVFQRWNNIKDRNIRERQIRLFKKFWEHWGNKSIANAEVKWVNNELKPFNVAIVKSSERDPQQDNGYSRDEEYYDVVTLGENTMWGGKHPIMYSYTLDELFEEDMYEEWRDHLVGSIDDEELEDYYLTTNDIIRFVLWMNENEGTNYDGIIIPDIYDIGPTGGIFDDKTTDIITLISSNQIKRIDNTHPTNSNNIDESNDSFQVELSSNEKADRDYEELSKSFANYRHALKYYNKILDKYPQYKIRYAGPDGVIKDKLYNIEIYKNNSETLVSDTVESLKEKLNTVNDLSSLCKKLNQKHNTFGGNCGNFALALARELTKQDIEVGIVICSSIYDEDLEDSNYSPRSYEDFESDIYHVAIMIGNTLFDGNGITNIKALKKIAKEEYGDSNPNIYTHKYSKENDDDFRFAFEWGTKYDVSPEYYQDLLQKQFKNLVEKFVDFDSGYHTYGQVQITESSYEVKDRIVKSTIPLRILYDSKLNVYALGEADTFTHQDLFSVLEDQGYYKFDYKSRAEYLGSGNIHEFIYDTKYDSETVSWFGEDGYYKVYVYKFGVIGTRTNTFENSELAKVLGPYEKVKVLTEEIKKDNKLHVYRVGDVNTSGPSFFADKLEYFDHSQTGYDKEDALEYILDLDGAKIFDPKEELGAEIFWWDDICVYAPTFKEFGIPYEEYEENEEYGHTTTDDIADWACKKGYDVVIFKNVPSGDSFGPDFTEYAVCNSSRIKLITK